VRRKLKGSGFQIVFDINGREAEEAEPLVDALGRDSLEQYIYCSRWGRVGGCGAVHVLAAGGWVDALGRDSLEQYIIFVPEHRHRYR
jgi:hypothetical protein